MSDLEITLFGAPRIELDGAPVELDTRKATALLAYLAVTEQHHTRAALAALLWPEYDHSRARAALRRTLSTLNKALQGAHLEISRQAVELNFESGVAIDTKLFQALIIETEVHDHPPGALCPTCIAQLKNAVAIYQADFLAGFSLRDSSNFDDWQFFEADQLRRRLGEALERLVESLSVAGSYQAAIQYAKRWLSLDPLREGAHRWLMKSYEWSGQRGAALRQYRECVRVLDKELSVPPLEETEALYAAILKRQLPKPETAKAPVSSIPTPITQSLQTTATEGSIYPLVGRAGQLAELINTYETHGGAGYFALISGEAGIGKTRLAAEFTVHAARLGANVITMRCYEGERDLAYSPIIGGIRAFLAQDGVKEKLKDLNLTWAIEATRLFPELGAAPAPPELSGPGAQNRFFEGLRQLLLVLLAGKMPGVLFLDDLHWADSSTLDLLAYITHRLDDFNVFILAASRDGNQDAVQRVHQMRAAAARAGMGSALTLERLNQDHLRDMTQAAAGDLAGLPEDLLSRLYAETEGLPFFAVEYLHNLLQSTPLGTSGELAETEWSLPESVRDLMNARLDALSQAADQLTSAAAVIGRSFDFDTLHISSGRSVDETLLGLEELLSHGLVLERPGGAEALGVEYDFSHNKLRTFAYQRASLTRRRLLHRRVAEALVERQRELGAPAIEDSVIAHHLLKAGLDSKAASYFFQAAQRASTLYAHQQALTHYQASLSSGYPEPAEIHEAVGDIQTLLGNYTAAIQSYERSAALAASNRLPPIEVKLGGIQARLGDYELATCYFTSAWEGVQSGEFTGDLDLAFQARLLANWSRSEHHQGLGEQAQTRAADALRLAEAADDPQALALVHNILGILARSRHDLSAASQHLESSLEFCVQADHPEGKIAALNNLGLVCAERGELETAIEHAHAALQICEKIGDRHHSAALYNHLADLYHRTGQPERAMEYLKTAVKIFGEIYDQRSEPRPQIWMLIEW